MVTEHFERVLRRMRQHVDKGGTACGATDAGLRIVGWRGWDDDWGRLLCLQISAANRPFLNLDEARRRAHAYFGGLGWLAACEVPDGNSVLYLLPLDLAGLAAVPPRRPRAQRPGFVRWFDARQLGAGIGTGGPVKSWHGRSIAAV